MEKYTFLREFADSWGLMAMFLFFLAVILFTFRPGTKAKYRDASSIPLRHDDVLEDQHPDNNPPKGQSKKERRT